MLSSSNCESISRGSSSKGKNKLYTFTEARRIARTYGFTTRQEFIEYESPGAYQVPKNPKELWSDEWRGWDDFLGMPLQFCQGRAVARELAAVLGLSCQEEFLDVMKRKMESLSEDELAMRFPFRPDLYYKNDGWAGWDDWLGC